MNEKLLTVLVIVSLVLSVFNLVLLLRTNNGTEILGQSSGVTWKKVELPADVSEYGTAVLSSVPLWNVTITLQWSNSTISVCDLGDTYPWSQGASMGYATISIKGTTIFYGHIIDSSFYYPDTSPTANITSITAYEIQPPS